MRFEGFLPGKRHPIENVEEDQDTLDQQLLAAIKAEYKEDDDFLFEDVLPMYAHIRKIPLKDLDSNERDLLRQSLSRLTHYFGDEIADIGDMYSIPIKKIH